MIQREKNKAPTVECKCNWRLTQKHTSMLISFQYIPKDHWPKNSGKIEKGKKGWLEKGNEPITKQLDTGQLVLVIREVKICITLKI